MNNSVEKLKSDLDYLKDKKKRFEDYKKKLESRKTKIIQNLKISRILRVSLPFLGLLLFKIDYGIFYNGLVYLICVGAAEIYIIHKEIIYKSDLSIVDIDIKQNNAEIYKNAKETDVVKQKLSRLKSDDKVITSLRVKDEDFAPLEIDFSRARRFKN